MSNNLQPQKPPSEPVNRLVLLGASNLTLSFRMVIELMQERCGRPSDVLAAVGHGRSYGEDSQVLIRGLPSINDSELWSHLDSADSLPTYAFLTDIGNDIPYGYKPEQILRWVGRCIEQLQKHSARIVMTNIPLASIEPLSEKHYKIIRAIFFPFSRLSRHEVIERAREVHCGLLEMADSYNFELYEQDPSWYGPDVIHVLLWKRKAFYRQIFERLPVPDMSAVPEARRAMHAQNWAKRPRFAYKKVLGKPHCHPQPSGRLTDGTDVYMY